MKSVSIVLVLYSLSMVFYGVGEMAHDLFHFLGSLHLSTLHYHDHDHGHSIHDHEHGHTHHHDQMHEHTTDQNPNESLPLTINFFLFTQTKPIFTFCNTFVYVAQNVGNQKQTGLDRLPPTPPPRS